MLGHDNFTHTVSHVLAQTWLKVALVVLCIFSAGCSSQNVVEGISQEQATEIVSLFADAGIAGKIQKSSGSQSGYIVSVRGDQYTQAIVLLHAHNLPRREELTFAESIAQRGFLPSSRDIEALRLDRARAAELEEALRVLPTVKEIRAIVRTGQNSTPSVSLIIKRTDGATVDENAIVQMVLKAVPGVSAESVQITAVDAVDKTIKNVMGVKNKDGIVVSLPLVPFLGVFNVPEVEISTLSLTIFGGVILIAGLGAFLGYWFGFLQKTRVELDQERVSSFPRLAKRSVELPKITRD
jgi:type III secretory pathway lipoprotein EscJ